MRYREAFEGDPSEFVTLENFIRLQKEKKEAFISGFKAAIQLLRDHPNGPHYDPEYSLDCAAWLEENLPDAQTLEKGK